MSEQDTNFLLRELVEMTKELVRWSRPQGIATVKKLLAETLAKDEEKLAYHHSDGKSSQEVGRLAGVAHGTVTVYWKRWSTLGVVEPMKVQGGTRYRRVFSLEDLGIEVPKARTPNSVEPEPVNNPVVETQVV